MGPAAAQVNVHEAKTHLSRLLERVEQGEEIVVARDGRPIARLVPFIADLTPHQPGAPPGAHPRSGRLRGAAAPEILSACVGDARISRSIRGCCCNGSAIL